ncbi:hypothetical protein KP509_21G022300 [Ceratopteris richardii]|uniref:Mannose-P-dolichol utilization defect 1 protein homolog n=1 Tax=Ceratopteris richardii TaxID=49495 RepID=A0A8T2SAW5_CERRI|nr:hypothetical protein KP509_21G022300 [Ceratopteris richardii]KAH7314824.1 hypothetical protein KP509_21G022300 [Ceratopteris richardii]
MDLSCISESLGSKELPSLNGCLLPLLSKLIGYSIIATSTVCKVPQIYLILKNKSIEGLSIPSFELEVIGFTIALAYCMFNQLAFSAYGELVFLVIQSIIQVALMYYYSPPGISKWLKSGLYCAIAPVLMAGNLDPVLFETLYASQHAIFLVSKIPQIKENFQNKSTGQLSFVTNFLNFGGVFARLFTSLQEKAPISMVVGCLLGIITNTIIMWQFLIYRESQPKKTRKVD